MTKLLIKLTIKLLKWLRDNKKVNVDLNNNDINDLNEWIDYLNTKLEK